VNLFYMTIVRYSFMGSWTPGALEKYQKDCVARGGTVVPDPMMAARCIEPDQGEIPEDDEPLPILEPDAIRPIHTFSPTTPYPTTTAPRRSNTTTILIMVIVVLVLLLSAGAAFMFMTR
jgi:hypothetical protein